MGNKNAGSGGLFINSIRSIAGSVKVNVINTITREVLNTNTPPYL